MKLIFTLYGCGDYVRKQSPDRLALMIADFKKVFGIVSSTIIGQPGSNELVPVEINLNAEHVPIPHTYIADVFWEKERVHTEQQESLLLHRLAETCGMSWTEFVRAFINSGGLIAIRVATKTTQVRWSPHGTDI